PPVPPPIPTSTPTPTQAETLTVITPQIQIQIQIRQDTSQEHSLASQPPNTSPPPPPENTSAEQLRRSAITTVRGSRFGSGSGSGSGSMGSMGSRADDRVGTATADLQGDAAGAKVAAEAEAAAAVPASTGVDFVDDGSNGTATTVPSSQLLYDNEVARTGANPRVCFYTDEEVEGGSEEGFRATLSVRDLYSMQTF
ncbi:hypothetical protein Vretimale_6285, partial [Volvox reticuliferus]